MFTPEGQRALLAGDGVIEDGAGGVTTPGDLRRRLDAGTIDPVTAFSAFELSNYLRNTLLRDTDTMSMAHALEVRVPLLDHVLVERVMRTPGRLKIHGRENKRLLSAVVPSLPRSAVDRSKMGFTLPYDAWFRGPLRAWMEERILDPRVGALGIVDRRGVERLWASYLRGDASTTFTRVWCVAAFVGWCEVNRVSI